MLYQVDYLLSISRFPERFFASVKGLEGPHAQAYQNPGRSLRSFLVAKHLRDEMVSLDAAMLEVLQECEHFCTYDSFHVAAQQVLDQTMGLMVQIDADISLRADHTREITELRTLMVELNHQLVSVTADDVVDPRSFLSSNVGAQLRHRLYRLQDKLEQIDGLIRDRVKSLTPLDSFLSPTGPST